MGYNTPVQPPTHLTRGYFAAIGAALVLSLTSILIRHLTEAYALPALVLAAWRALFVTVTLLVGLALFTPRLLRLELIHIPYLVAFGFILSLFNSAWTISVAINGAAVGTVLAYSSVAFTVLLAPLMLKEKLNLPKVLAVLLSLAGCILVSRAYAPQVWQTAPGGILAGLLSGLAYAAYTMIGRGASHRGINPWTTLLYAFAFDAVFLFAYALLGRGILPGSASSPADLLWLGDRWLGWLILFLLAAGPTAFGFILYNISLHHLPAGIVNLIATSEPVWSAAIAYFLLGETLTWVQITGSLLILGAVLLLRLWERIHPEDPVSI